MPKLNTVRAIYLNPFIEASCNVLKEVLNLNLSRGKLNLHSGDIDCKGAAIIIQFSGDLEGRLIMIMSEETAIKIASRMLENIEMDAISVLDDLGKASITEMANMITGRSITKLSRLGFNINLNPPTLVFGVGNSVVEAHASPHLYVPLTLNIGFIELHIAVREGSLQ